MRLAAMKESCQKSRGLRIAIVIGLPILGLCGLFIYKLSGLRLTGLLGECLFHKVTGLYCPGCGGTRAVQALLDGHLLAALRYNMFTLLLLLYAALCYLQFAYNTFARKPAHILPFSANILWVVLAVLIVFCVARNVLWLGFGIGIG